jgi:hypothetical protein
MHPEAEKRLLEKLEAELASFRAQVVGARSKAEQREAICRCDQTERLIEAVKAGKYLEHARRT